MAPDEIPQIQSPPLLDIVTSCRNGLLSDADASLARRWLVAAERDASAEPELVQIYRVALVPHKRIPNEILREIFILSAMEELYFPLSTYLNSLLVPPSIRSPNIRICLARVSSHWRAVALETHELWADVDLDYTISYSIVPLLNLVNLWFSRSGNLPLSLRITGGAFANRDVQLTELLVRYSPRYLEVERDILLVDFLKQPPGSLDRLETLHLGDAENYEGDFGIESATVLGGAPRLRTVLLYQVFGAAQMGALPWHQLCHLTHECSTTAEDFYFVLKECSGLRSARINLRLLWKIQIVDHNIVFSHLQHLALLVSDEDQAILFLNTLLLPSLFNLRLEARSHHNVGFPERTVFFPMIKILSVNLNGLQDTSRWMHIWNTVEELYLPGCSLTASLSDKIAAGELLPNATLLVVHDVDISALTTMLEARLANSTFSTITHVGINALVGRSDPCGDEVERLGKLLERGVFVARLDGQFGEYKRPTLTELEATARSQSKQRLGAFAALKP